MRDIMNSGKIVPSTITCGLLKREMDNSPGGKDNIFLIDGYPRNLGNIEAWNEVFGSQSKILCVLFLDCALDVCMERLIKRSETSGRSDDDVNIIKKRFVTFQNENKPILETMEKMTKIVNVDSTGKEDEVFGRICEQIDVIIINKQNEIVN